MNGFWHALLRVNARFLAAGAGFMLAASLLGWLVSLAAPRLPVPVASPATPAGLKEPAARPDDRPAGQPGGSAPNPFESEHLSELVALSDEGLLTWDAPREPPRDPAPAPAAPPPEPRTITVEYVGLFTRTDKVTVALLKRDAEERATHYPADAPLVNGVRVVDIQRDHVELAVGDRTVVVQNGERKVVEY